MSFTVAEILTETRELLLDSLSPYRYSDEFIIRKVNQVLRRMAVMRPDLFVVHTTIACVSGTLQAAPTDSVRMLDVIANADGDAVKEINQDTLDMMYPDWSSSAPATTINWMRYPRDPNRFYVYPPALGGEDLQIVYARSPAAVDANSTVSLPDAYAPTVLDGTCWLMEAIDAEHVESGRAKAFKDAFEASLTAGLTVRRLTDVDASGLPKDEVV